MINYTARLDEAIRKSAWAHEKAKQYRKGTDIPYIIHPFGVMTIASNVTNDEDTLIACLLHDILEDVDPGIYNEKKIIADFGEDVVSIIKDVTKDSSLSSWHDQSNAYLSHIKNKASDKAIIVCLSDKIHNLVSTITDHAVHGDEIWDRFSTKSSSDQLWWYDSILETVKERKAPSLLIDQLSANIEILKYKMAL